MCFLASCRSKREREWEDLKKREGKREWERDWTEIFKTGIRERRGKRFSSG